MNEDCYFVLKLNHTGEPSENSNGSGMHDLVIRLSQASTKIIFMKDVVCQDFPLVTIPFHLGFRKTM